MKDVMLWCLAACAKLLKSMPCSACVSMVHMAARHGETLHGGRDWNPSVGRHTWFIVSVYCNLSRVSVALCSQSGTTCDDFGEAV